MSLSDMAAEGSALFVLVHSDAIAGFVQVDHTREGIFKLSVHESLRGNDYGELLMQAAEAHAKSLGWEEVWLGILKPWLVDYYGKQDYVLTTRREKMEGMPDVEFLMLCKQLIG
jgi:GNAT superfamily N-acetyltransferase